MSRNLKHALKHFWLWRKNYLWNCLGFSLVCSFVMHFFPFKHPMLHLLLAGASFLFIFTGFTKDIFSWKYYQSLPLTKKELYHYHLIIQYLIYLPFVMWYFCFPDYTNDLFFEHDRFSWRLSVGVLIVYLVGTLFIGIASFYQNFELIRKPFVKSDHRLAFLQTSRNLIYIISGLILFGLGIYLLCDAFPAFQEFVKWVGIIGAVSAVPGFFLWYYFYTFHRWNREELSYFKNNFKTSRDVPLMILGSLVIVMLFQAPKSESVSGMYGKTGKKGIFRAIQTRNRAEFEKLILDKNELMSVTEMGWTPLMVAAHSGSGTMFLDLLKAGASVEGKVNSPDDPIHHGLNLFMLAVDGNNLVAVEKLINPENVKAIVAGRTALHTAAYNCDPQIIDLLLEKGASPNAVNKGGSTALHVAARSNCFAGAVSLIEAGADPLIKNNKNQIAENLLMRRDKQFGYYLQKKGRLPAGK